MPSGQQAYPIVPGGLITGGEVAFRCMAEVEAFRGSEPGLSLQHKEQEVLRPGDLQAKRKRGPGLQLKEFHVKRAEIQVLYAQIFRIKMIMPGACCCSQMVGEVFGKLLRNGFTGHVKVQEVRCFHPLCGVGVEKTGQF